MITATAMQSNLGRSAIPIFVAILFCLVGCSVQLAPPGASVVPAAIDADAFVMSDGVRLPFRAWMPEQEPKAVVLALHGMNDSRNAWEYPAPDLAKAGIAVFAPDQRGFGAAPGRGLWAGAARMVDDAADMVVALKATYPGLPLFQIGRAHV